MLASKLKIILLHLLFGQINGQCETVFTAGGTRFPQRCVFPFRHNGNTYHECTSVKDPDGRRWCSVKVDGNQISDSFHEDYLRHERKRNSSGRNALRISVQISGQNL